MPTSEDLRLVPSALLAWATAYEGVHLPFQTLTALAPWVGTAVTCAMVAALYRAQRTYPARHRYDKHWQRAGTHDTLSGTVAVALAACLAIGVVTVTHRVMRQHDPLSQAIDAAEPVQMEGRLLGTPRVVISPTGHAQVIVDMALSSIASSPRLTRQVSHPTPQAPPRPGHRHHSRQQVRIIADHQWLACDEGDVITLEATPQPALHQQPFAGVIHTQAAPTIIRGPRLLSLASMRRLVRSRMQAALACTAHGCTRSSDALLLAVALGRSSMVDHSLTQYMRTSGLAHITAVSGQHVAIVTALWMGVVHRRSRTIRAIGGVGALIIFVLLVGASPSVLRACVMGILSMAALYGGRTRLSFPALSLAVWVLLMVDPWQAARLGFHLSVVCTAVLMALAQPLMARLSALPSWLAASLAMALSAFIATSPLLLSMNQGIAGWSIAANIAVAPVIALLVFDAVGVAVLSLISVRAAHLLAWPGVLAARWIAGVAETTSALPGSILAWPQGSGGVVLLLCAHGLMLWAIFHGPKVLIHSVMHGRLRPWQHEHGNNPPPPAPPGTRSHSRRSF